jgi:hypothetical protein
MSHYWNTHAQSVKNPHHAIKAVVIRNGRQRFLDEDAARRFRYIDFGRWRQVSQPQTAMKMPSVVNTAPRPKKASTTE